MSDNPTRNRFNVCNKVTVKESLPEKPQYLNSPEKKLVYTRKLFAQIADKYDLLNRILSFNRDSAWKNCLIKMLPKGEINNCLDIACGTGDVTCRLSEKYPNAKILGIDSSTRMIEIAKIKKNNANIEYLLTDMNSLPFPEHHFDIVTGCYALRNAPDLSVVLPQINRVAKPNAIICFMDFSKPANEFFQRIEFLLLKSWFWFWSFIFFRNVELYDYIVETLRLFPDSKKLKTILEEKGFQIINSKKHCLGIIEIIICKI